MLSSPNVNDLMEKAGNRYETALAVAKRARAIAAKRLARGDLNIKDTVDIAAEEINNGIALVKIDGEYVCKHEMSEKDIDTTITETVEGILKDLDVLEETEMQEDVVEEVSQEKTKSKRGRKPKIKEEV